MTPDPAGWPRVSVVIAARNAAATLPSCLASLRALDYPSVEILLVDDGSSDATAEIAESAGVRVLQSAGGASAARNLGAREAAGDVLAFTDADCEVPPHWLRALVTPLRRPGIVSAGGPQVHVFANEDHASAAIRSFLACASVVAEYSRTGGGEREVPHNASCNSVYDRAAFLAMNGFTEGLWPAEDVDLDRRLALAGHRCWFVPGAAVRHRRQAGLGWFGRMMRRYGRGQGVLVRRYGIFRPIQALAFVALAGILLQAGWAWPAARPWMAAAHGIVLLAALVTLARCAPVRQWAAVAGVGGIAVAEWLAGFLAGILTNRTAGGTVPRATR